MFASIFFHDDSGLTVVGQDSNQLELQGHFAERELVKLKWGKSMYTGTIVKVHGKTKRNSLFRLRLEILLKETLQMIIVWDMHLRLAFVRAYVLPITFTILI